MAEPMTHPRNDSGFGAWALRRAAGTRLSSLGPLVSPSRGGATQEGVTNTESVSALQVELKKRQKSYRRRAYAMKVGQRLQEPVQYK